MKCKNFDFEFLEQIYQKEHYFNFGAGDETHTRDTVAHHEAGHALIYALMGF